MSRSSGVQDLMESLQIFAKYDNGAYSPTNCDHDVIHWHAIDDVNDVSPEDVKRLEELGWDISYEYGVESFYSYRFGSC